MTISRRTLLGSAAAAGGLVATGGLGALAAAHRLPRPAASGLDHVVVLCMENRSFDHFLGWLPGADGQQPGLAYADDSGVLHPTQHWPDRHGCGFGDPGHSVADGQVQLNGGACDGFRKSPNDDYALSYYTADDLPLLRPLTRAATVCDRWFSPILGPTYPNRFYLHAGRTPQLDNTNQLATVPTIWDRLAAAGVPANYYFSDLPFVALWGPKYLPIGRPLAAFFADAAAGTLPAVSYLDPFFLGEEQGGSNDDHPHADIHRGQALMSSIVRALADSPLWDRTLFVVTYDEWGGFFDHVPPPVQPDDAGPNLGQTGFRVPAVLFSPFARPGRVDHGVYDHTSVLKLIEWRWGLAPLAPRDAAATNLAAALDFSRPNLVPPALPAVADPGPHLCDTEEAGSFWHDLAGSPLMRGWQGIG